MNFAKWLEYSDLGGEVSYNHMNNVVAQDSFSKIRSKYMAGHKRERSSMNCDKLFGRVKKGKKISEVTDLENKEKDQKVLNLVKKGEYLKKPKCGYFWDDFINLCSNLDAASVLFDVPKEKVSKWSQIINNLREYIKKEDSYKFNKKMLKTGE